MKKFLPFLVVFFVFVNSSLLFAQNPPKAKVMIVNMADSSATHVYGDRFNAKIQEVNVFDYGKYSVDEISRVLRKSGCDVIALEAPIYYRSADLQNFIGQPSKIARMWLADIQSKYDADFLIVIKHKFIPDENLSDRFLEKQQYGLATYLYAPDVLSVFSFVGYYIFSLKDQKNVKINPNHDRHVILDIPLESPMTGLELKVVPQEYQDMAGEQLRYIADTRNAEIERVILETISKLK